MPEPATSHQRGQQRIRRTALTGIATLVAKGSGVLFGLIAIPLTASALGTERFGLWLVIGNFLTWVSLADLGLGNSLTNLVATADAEENQQQVRSAVTTALAITLMLCLGLACLAGLSYPWLNWLQVFHLSNLAIAPEAGQAAIVATVIFGLRLLLSIPIRLYTAYQQGYIYQLWAGLGSLLSLIGLLIGLHYRLSFPWLLGLFFGGMAIADLWGSIYFFTQLRPQLRPHWQYFDRSLMWLLLRQGSQFWLIQVAAIVYLQTDFILVNQLFGAAAVASYGIAFKLFALVDFVQTAFLNPLWSAYSEALARQDRDWILITFRRSLLWSIGWAIGSGLILVLFTPYIVGGWLGKTETPSLALMIAMFCLTVTTAIGKCIAYLLNGLGQLGSQTLYGILAAIANIGLSLLLGKAMGSSGVTWATVICIVVFSIGLVGRDAYKILQKTSLPRI